MTLSSPPYFTDSVIALKKDAHRNTMQLNLIKGRKMAVKIPEWPLSCDWKWAGEETKPAPTADSPHPSVQCDHCTQWLSLKPNDETNGVRRHKRGLKCKKGREVVTMNREGYHVMCTEGPGFWAEALRPFMREGKFYKFFPAPIVAFIRWKLPNNGRSSAAPKEFHDELVRFLALTELEQTAQLAGARLAHEFSVEENLFTVRRFR